MDAINKKSLIIGAIIIVALVGLFFVFRSVSLLKPTTPTQPVGQSTPQGVVVAPGTSPVASSGQVVTQQGKPVELDASPGTVNAPQQSNPIAANAAPAGSVKLSVSTAGFSPSKFSVHAGDAVTLTLTASDDQTHVLLFDDSSLSAIAIGVGPGETRAITFNAPKAGNYTFHCDVPGHAARGEKGTMTVN